MQRKAAREIEGTGEKGMIHEPSYRCALVKPIREKEKEKEREGERPYLQ